VGFLPLFVRFCGRRQLFEVASADVVVFTPRDEFRGRCFARGCKERRCNLRRDETAALAALFALVRLVVEHGFGIVGDEIAHRRPVAAARQNTMQELRVFRLELHQRRFDRVPFVVVNGHDQVVRDDVERRIALRQLAERAAARRGVFLVFRHHAAVGDLDQRRKIQRDERVAEFYQPLRRECRPHFEHDVEPFEEFLRLQTLRLPRRQRLPQRHLEDFAQLLCRRQRDEVTGVVQAHMIDQALEYRRLQSPDESRQRRIVRQRLQQILRSPGLGQLPSRLVHTRTSCSNSCPTHRGGRLRWVLLERTRPCTPAMRD
jgi:hypothetical protein